MTLSALALGVVTPLLVIGAVIAMVRVLRGPSLPDRLVAFDVMMSIAVGLVGTYALATGHWAFLDVAVFVALVSFLGSVAFARYLERRAR